MKGYVLYAVQNTYYELFVTNFKLEILSRFTCIYVKSKKKMEIRNRMQRIPIALVLTAINQGFNENQINRIQ